MRWPRAALLGVAILLPACAGAQRPPETPTAARLKDSTPEKVAAQRAASPQLRLEEDDARWGISAAQERKHARDEQRRKAASLTDIRATPTVEVAPVKP
jgi:hypothetical protein